MKYTQDDFDEETLRYMTSPKVEMLKQLIYLKFFDNRYTTDLSIALKLHLSEPSFYRYERQAKKMYEYSRSIKDLSKSDRH